MSCPAPGEAPAVRTTILDDTAAAKVPRSAGQGRKKPKSERRSGFGGQMDRAQTMAEWEPQRCVNTEMNGARAPAFWGLDVWKASIPNCGRSALRWMWQSSREKHCKCME